MSKLTIDMMRDLASKRAGKCLSNDYKNNLAKLLWRCPKGHEWEAAAASILRGSWCPFCVGRRKTVLDMQRWAQERGGFCLSSEYVNPTTKLLWKCSVGHEWQAIPNAIQQGGWCPFCAGKAPLTLAQRLALAKKHAAQKGGDIVSAVIPSGRTPVLWKCAAGHIWKARLDNVIHTKTWCPTCAGVGSVTFERANRVAGQYGGRCLSNDFKYGYEKALWECRVGHQWKAAVNNILRRLSWCPKCSEGVGERIARAYFEQLLGKPFQKIRPAWLQGFRRYPLELDGYNAELKIAFEHQGKQHDKYINLYHSNDEKNFLDMQARDKRKLELCKKHGVALIQIPQINLNFSPKKLKRFIQDELKRFGLDVSEEFEKKEVDLAKVFSPDRLANFGFNKIPKRPRLSIETLQNYAISKGGICEAFEGVNFSRDKATWKCANGHVWKAKYKQVKREGGWCPVCEKSKRDKQRSKRLLEPIQTLAKSKGGLCRSSVYHNKHRMDFCCERGHQFKRSATSVKAGLWCPYCKRQIPLGMRNEKVKARWLQMFNRVKEFAAQKGGRCLSEEFLGARVKQRFRCSQGHEWESNYDNSVLRGCWCPVCSKNLSTEKRRTLTIERLRAHAKERGGDCLSEKRGSSDEYHRWKCAKGHVWDARIKNVINLKQWCPFCAGKYQTIDAFKTIAKERGGECLSEKYISAKSKMLWRCSEGHTWLAAPDSIKRGSWCSVCRRGWTK